MPDELKASDHFFIALINIIAAHEPEDVMEHVTELKASGEPILKDIGEVIERVLAIAGLYRAIAQNPDIFLKGESDAD